MRRREVIAGLGCAALAPLAAGAQSSMPVIGWLHSADGKSFASELAAFRQSLQENGYEEGRNLAIEYRWAEGQFDRLPALAADLVRRNVQVIAAVGGNNSNLAAKAATSTIPIVFTSGADPVRLGLVESLSRPGGNVTGVNFLVVELAAKGLGVLHEFIPRARTMALLINPSSRESIDQTPDTRDAAARLGLDLRIVHASNAAEVDQAFEAMARDNIDALLVAGEATISMRIDRIVELAARHRIPAIYTRREWVLAGGLMSYGTNFKDGYRQAGLYVARILKGARPADLPVVQSTTFEFVINLKTAKALGLEFHPQLLGTADEVVE
jgi:putative ABC transport system substrate-binding protein